MTRRRRGGGRDEAAGRGGDGSPPEQLRDESSYSELSDSDPSGDFKNRDPVKEKLRQKKRKKQQLNTAIQPKTKRSNTTKKQPRVSLQLIDVPAPTAKVGNHSGNSAGNSAGNNSARNNSARNSAGNNSARTDSTGTQSKSRNNSTKQGETGDRPNNVRQRILSQFEDLFGDYSSDDDVSAYDEILPPAQRRPSRDGSPAARDSSSDRSRSRVRSRSRSRARASSTSESENGDEEWKLEPVLSAKNIKIAGSTFQLLMPRISGDKLEGHLRDILKN